MHTRRYKITGKAPTRAFPWPAPPTPKQRILAQRLLPSKFFQNGKVSGHPKDTGNQNFWDFCTKGSFLEALLLFLRNFQNFLQTQTLAQDALNMQPEKIFQKRKVSVRSEDTGNINFVEFFKRELFLKKSYFDSRSLPGARKSPCIKVGFSPQKTCAHKWD